VSFFLLYDFVHVPGVRGVPQLDEPLFLGLPVIWVRIKIMSITERLLLTILQAIMIPFCHYAPIHVCQKGLILSQRGPKKCCLCTIDSGIPFA
jgi:hypothetical protein